MPKWSSEGMSVVALLVFKLAFWILVIYYKKWGLFQLKLAPLYVRIPNTLFAINVAYAKLHRMVDESILGIKINNDK